VHGIAVYRRMQRLGIPVSSVSVARTRTAASNVTGLLHLGGRPNALESRVERNEIAEHSPLRRVKGPERGFRELIVGLPDRSFVSSRRRGFFRNPCVLRSAGSPHGIGMRAGIQQVRRSCEPTTR
jgi:hypothetical protein